MERRGLGTRPSEGVSMLALVVLLAVPIIMWIAQTVLLRAGGRPVRWRLSAAGLPPHLRQLNRVITNVALALGVLVFPLLRGEEPLEYYARYLPAADWPHAVLGLGAAMLYLSLLYLAWVVTDQVRFRVRHQTSRLVRKLALVPLTAVLVALIEELIFRAMLLADLLRTLDAWVAVPLGALLFAGAHYVRSVKRYWTFPGHLMLGLLLCTAFVLTGNVWLALGLHAGGVVMLMGTRPLIRYHGPPWLVGASIFPYAGVVGIAALALLTANLVLIVGGGV